MHVGVRTGDADLLSRQALNRATLQRQLLLNRVPASPCGVLEHLVGMQGQAPRAPYVGLWSRVAGFNPRELSELVAQRAVVRAPLMRATVHLVTVGDFCVLRQWLGPMLRKSFAASPFAKRLTGVELADLASASSSVFALATRPLTRRELGAELLAQWPGRDPTALAYAASYLLPLVQAAPRGMWGTNSPVRWANAADLADGASSARPLDELVLRYLAAFGPASVRDVQTWSGLTHLREVIDGLRPRLREFRDEAGRALWDVPDGPRPDPGTPAPPRFLPEYDNLFFGYADRGRICAEGQKVVLPALPPGDGGRTGTLLVDGLYQGTWALVRQGKQRGEEGQEGRAGRAGRDKGAILRIETFGRLNKKGAAGVIEEGERLLAFIAPEVPDRAVVLPAT